MLWQHNFQTYVNNRKQIHRHFFLFYYKYLYFFLFLVFSIFLKLFLTSFVCLKLVWIFFIFFSVSSLAKILKFFYQIFRYFLIIFLGIINFRFILKIIQIGWNGSFGQSHYEHLKSNKRFLQCVFFQVKINPISCINSKRKYWSKIKQIFINEKFKEKQ